MLSLQIYRDTTMSGLLADYSRHNFRFSTNRHGFSALSAPFIAMPLYESFAVYEWPGTPHVVVSDHAAGVVWEGRLEDIGIVDGGVSLTAFGYQRAMGDVPYTALWSKSGSADWKEVTGDELAGATPERYEIDNNNRLYIAPRKGETFFDNTNFGALSWVAPSAGERSILSFSADYAILLPAGMRARIYTSASYYSSEVLEAGVTGTGSLQTGTWSFNTTARARIRFQVGSIDSGGGSYTESGNTGSTYARLTNIRIKSTSGSVLASNIAAALATFVNGINPAQLSPETTLIEATSTDLRDELYEDEWPADILDRLALLHGYEWGVYDGRMMHFRPAGSGGRSWYVDAARLELQRSLDKVRNSAYGVYRSEGGQTLRTANADDADSQARYGLTRRGFVNVQSTSLAEAQTHRGVWLTDHANMQARARIEFDRVYDATGGQWPLYMMRAGDTVTIRNLPPTLSTGIDQIRIFRIGETDYDAATNEIAIAPDDPVPTLVTLVARRESGL